MHVHFILQQNTGTLKNIACLVKLIEHTDFGSIVLVQCILNAIPNSFLYSIPNTTKHEENEKQNRPQNWFLNGYNNNTLQPHSKEHSMYDPVRPNLMCTMRLNQKGFSFVNIEVVPKIQVKYI